MLGSFNPSIFQPWWLARQQLIDEGEADAAEVGIIHPDIVSFRIGALTVDVGRERFQVQTDDATAFEALRDLVVGTFGRLSHTPVGAMGINRSTHHALPTAAAWNKLGHALVPKAPWEGILEHPGTRSLTVEGRRPDGREGYVRASFEPSNAVRQGVFQMINDHFGFNGGDPTKNVPAAEVMTVLADVWDESLERARTIADHLLTVS